MAEDLSLNLVAIDVGRYWNAVLIEPAGGKKQRFRMANTAADFERLLGFLQALPGNCRVALEPTGDYHRPLANRLLRAGHEVVGINSVAQARYREALFNSWDKNDPKDAQVILEMLRRGVYQRFVDPQLAGYHDLQELAKTYYQVSRARTKVQHSLINHCLPLYYPEMHRYWCTTRNEWFVRFMLEFPTPAHVRTLDRDAFVNAAWELVGRKVDKRAKLEEIWESAAHTTALPHDADSLAVETFRITLRRYQELNALRAEPAVPAVLRTRFTQWIDPSLGCRRGAGDPVDNARTFRWGFYAVLGTVKITHVCDESCVHYGQQVPLTTREPLVDCSLNRGERRRSRVWMRFT